jgi:single-stranded-DNA-specific exonuclease
VSAIEQVERAKSYGMRVVVTDHHTVGERLPRADAVVNPHRSDSSYPFRDLSGAGVVFKLCAGIGRELGIGMTSYYRAFLDLAALGTIADVMPLVGENRIIARFGMPQIKSSQKPGIRALLRASGLAERAASGLKAHHVSFVLGPRLNAAGRLDDAALSLSLLLSQDEGVAADLAARLEQLNELRRAEQERIAEEAIELVLATGRHDKPVIVVWGEDWHAGVVGIVASRLVERFRRPVFVGYADAEAGTLRASGRSITGFHLADAIRAHPELLEGGGHAMAAGFSASLGDAEKVEAALSEYGQKLLSEDDFVPKAPVDSDVEPSELTLEAVEAMSAMEPFGFGNAEPVMLVRGVAVADVLPTRNPEHPLVSLAVDGVGIVKAAAFGLGSILQEVPRGMRADALIKAGVDEWQGKRRVRWVLKDLRPEEQTTASTGELGLAHLADDEA